MAAAAIETRTLFVSVRLIMCCQVVEVDRDRDLQMLIENVEVNCGKDSLCQSGLVRNSLAAVMLIDWIVDISSIDQQRRLSETICQLCMTASWNAMQCSKAGMITSVVRCFQQSAVSAVDTSVVGECCCICTVACSCYLNVASFAQ